VSGWAWVAVAALGGAGALARFILDAAVEARVRGSFPLGTLAVNATGSLLLGLLAGLATSGETLVLAGTAALGSYTTFSTWMLETQRLGEDGEARGLALNVALGIVLGLAAAELGRLLGELL
jgi:CrcB protein